ncbi:hypothetical protein PSJ59_11955 [Escherichia coli]|uniref:hypothetical protein n=1 Tax=Escherichia coli TaxID=562 RepID=UPI0023582C1F|nr:hypothetical protein [Escherichia coli]MDC9182649.1 hypothetical protein [Escherichia coli]
MARYFISIRGSKLFAKIDEGMVFMRKRKYQTWNHWGKESEFVRMVAGGYWKEITAAEAGDLKYADCSQCAENWPELFDYHPDGYLISKVARGSGMNLIKPGDIIRGHKCTTKKGKEYLQISVYGHGYQLSRVVYEMFNGPIPDGYYIENADNSCTKIERLKLISKSERNLKSKINTISGIKGVYWTKTTNKWGAQISVNAINHNFGYFDNINDAIKARINGEIRYYGKQINEYPDYISPEEAERIKQRYYKGEEIKQIEINTEPLEQKLPRAFKFHGYDVRVNDADEINLMDIAAAYGVNDDELRHRIESLNKLPGYIYCTEHCDMQIKKGYAPFEIAGMIVARIGAEKDRVDLSVAFRKFKDNRISADNVQQTDSKQVGDLKYRVKTLEGQIKELHGVLNIAREDRDNYQQRVDYWKHQYSKANKAFGDEQGKRQKLESERDNLVKTNCELRQKLNAANDDDAKAKAAADKQTINDLRADLAEAKETIKAQQQDVGNKELAIKGYQLKLAELEEDKRELQNNVNILQSGYNQLSDRYNKLIARNMQRRAAQKRYMRELRQSFGETIKAVVQKMEGARCEVAKELQKQKRRQQRNHERYIKLIIALQDKVKELLYRLNKKPESGFFSKVKDLFHH